jgi:hypothetical protein
LKNGNARFRRGCSNMTEKFKAYNEGLKKGELREEKNGLKNGVYRGGSTPA